MDSPTGHSDRIFNRLRLYRWSRPPCRAMQSAMSPAGLTTYLAPPKQKYPPVPGNFIQHLRADVE